ncbi:MAG: hypothetical protein HOI23_22100 [Deltaproteobacteria bacterium]|jgi:hypothetical protein|nr:hypothetical protein [Deltaproteobacteria bacterium]MBT6433208.1 hypothetical protein [Deltaproteobacteria bacterium]MBT6488403.1 hypothetical protein [Deltaproteobacteria bacterium]
MTVGRFLNQTNSRVLPADYAGPVLICDIDKTYLSTRFSSIRGLMGIPFEFALDKEPIDGVVATLRAWRRGPTSDFGVTPMYFISGSPKQLRPVIENRMLLDGIEYDGITFKDQLGLLLRGKPKGIVEQIGYKLTSLLLYATQFPVGCEWYFFGDDVERDAEVFRLFGRVCGGLRGVGLSTELEGLGVANRDITNITKLAASLPHTQDPVRSIFIHLATGKEPQAPEDSRIHLTRSYLQTAMVLVRDGLVRDETVGTVARELRLRGTQESQIDFFREDAQSRFGIEET